MANNISKLIYLGVDQESILDVQKLDIYVLFIDDKPVVVNSDKASYLDISLYSFSQLKELIRNIYFNEHYNAIITFKERYQDFLWELTMDPLIRSISGNAIHNTRNKLIFRKILEKANINNVEFTAVNEINDLNDFKADVQSSVILKPSMGAGSNTVTLITPEQHMKVLPQITIPWMHDDHTKFIAEKYIPGEELSIESITINGEHQIVGIVKRRYVSDTQFVGKGHLTPAKLEKDLRERIKMVITKMLDAIDLKCGPAHTEIKIFEQDIYIIETQIRTGGASIWKLITLTTGINARNKIIAHLLEIPYVPETKTTEYAGICLLHSPPGIYKGIDESKLIAKDIVHYSMRFVEGEYMPGIRDSVDRRGFIIVKSDNYEDLNRRLEELDNIKIEIAPDGM